MAFKFTQTGAQIQTILDNAASQTDVQNAIYAAMITDTASGSIASFADGAAVPVADMTINIDYNAAGWTGANIYVRGFNLWDEETQRGTYYDTDGTLNAASAQCCCLNAVPIKPSTSYMFHSDEYRISRLFWYQLDGTYITYEAVSANDTAKTSPANAAYVRFQFPSAYGIPYRGGGMVAYPNTETTYHAYNGQNYAVSFGRTIYGGTLDPITGKLISNKAADGTDITPVEYDITPIVIPSLYGQNNIYADTGDVSVTYRADTKLYIAKVV